MKHLWHSFLLKTFAVTTAFALFCSPSHASSMCGSDECCNTCEWPSVWTVGAEYLFWQADQQGLAYAQEQVFPLKETQDINVKRKQLSFNSSPGVRIHVGVEEPCAGWDLMARWTYLDSSARGDSDLIQERDNDEVGRTRLLPFWTARGEEGIFRDSCVSLKARWKQKFNTFDVEWGKECFCGPCYTVRTHFGIRHAEINQSYRLENTFIAPFAVPVDSEELELISSEDVKLQQRYRATGLRGGFDSQYNLPCNLCLSGKLAASILYGKFNVKQRDENFFAVNEDVANGYQFVIDQHVIDQRSDCRGATFSTEIGLSIGWCYEFECNCSILDIKLGWENQIFFDQNHFDRIADLLETPEDRRANINDAFNGHRNLSLQGLTLSAVFTF